MYKWIMMALITSVAATTQAAQGDKTKDQFIAQEKAKWETKGWKWDQKKVEANFAEMDKNKDGIASGKERQEWFTAKKKEQAAKKKK